MDENNKKRSRKTKLVLRECMDSDDENIAVMQEEIEAALAQMKNKSILKKLSKQFPVVKPMQFSVKVEVEELDETCPRTESETGLNIKIDSVKSLSQPTPTLTSPLVSAVTAPCLLGAPRLVPAPPVVPATPLVTAPPLLPPPPLIPAPKEPTVVSFRIPEDVIRREFERQARETTSLADKLIEVNIRNYLGRKRKLTVTNPIDSRLQAIFRKTWKNWRNTFPEIRETPLLYKCYACSIAWWHLHDFREHVMAHKKPLVIEFKNICHESSLIAHDGTMYAKEKIYRIGSNCWRCGKDPAHHMSSIMDKNGCYTHKYRCKGCMEKFYTCTLLFEHECNCLLFQRIVNGNKLTKKVFECSLCPAKLSEEQFDEHMFQRHSVRSDLPEDWVLKTCSQCNYPFQMHALHDCSMKPSLTSCKFCLQTFPTNSFLLIHINATKHHYPCKICGAVLRKQCMEMQHLLDHTDNYAILYKCIFCSDIYFPTLDSINKHKVDDHHRKESNTLMTCYNVVAVPKTLVMNQPGYKNIEKEPALEPPKDPPDEVVTTLGEPCGSSDALDKSALRKKSNNKTEKKQILKNKCLPVKCKIKMKSILKKSCPRESDVINIVTSEEDEDEHTELLNKQQINVMPDTSRPSSTQEDVIVDTNTYDDTLANVIDIALTETYQENTKCVIKQEPYDPDIPIDNTEENANIRHNLPIQGIKTTADMFSNKDVSIFVIPPNELNQFDPYLVIKEENNYDEIAEPPQETEEINFESNIKIENVRIKEEPIDIPNDNYIMVETAQTIPDTDNINTLHNGKTKTDFKININKMKACINNKLESNINKLTNNIENDQSNLKINKLGVSNDNDNSNCNNHILKSDIVKLNANENDNSESNNDKLAKKTDNYSIKIGVDNDTNLFTLQIKEEPVDDTHTNFEVDMEELTYSIKEENLEELMEDDMIILDPSYSGPMNYEMDPRTNASVTSEEADLHSPEPPELVVYHSQRKRIYKCNKCSFRGYHQAYREHLQTQGHAGSRRAKDCLRKCRSTLTTVLYSCTKCSTGFPSWYKYIMHFTKVHNYKHLTCPKCFRQFVSMGPLQHHIQSHVKESFVNIYVIRSKEDENPEQFLQQCKICSQKISPMEFFKHWETHLQIVEVTRREQPPKGFADDMEHKHDLKKMLLLMQGLQTRSRTPEDKLQNNLHYCFKCKRRFERKNECKRHFIEHLLVDANQERHRHGCLKCQICSADFYTNERYKRHMREHASLPLYKCELCDKTFSDSSNFTKHKKVHNLSVLICDICKKKFTGKPFLEKHMMMHQKIKPLVCQECNKVFYTESSYKKHINRGKTRFKCAICHIFFDTLRDKWDHMWEIHRERKFEADCPVCFMGFRKHQDVRRHLRTAHQDVPRFKYVPNKTPIAHVDRVLAEADELVVVCDMD